MIAILDKHINPRWPYLPERKDDDENDDEIERSLSSVPDDPMNYDFFYHILEADENGRQPKIQVAIEVDEHGTPINTETVPNPKFNHKSQSCLRRIAESGNRVGIQSPYGILVVSPQERSPPLTCELDVPLRRIKFDVTAGSRAIFKAVLLKWVCDSSVKEVL